MKTANVCKVLFVSLIVSLSLSCSSNKSTGPQGNQPPATPSNPSPSVGATGQGTSLTLSWQCSDADQDSITYDVYLGLSSNPPLDTTAIHTASYHCNGLNSDTIYYWKVVAKDDHGHSTVGPIWSFSTHAILRWVGTYVSPGLIEDVAVSGNYAYVVDRRFGLQVVNIANPSSPSLIKTFKPMAEQRRICISGSTAYLTGFAHSGYPLDRSGRLSIVDIANPANPVELGRFDTTYLAAGALGDVTTLGHYVYCTATDGLLTFDVSVPSSPRWVSSCLFDSWFPNDLQKSGQYIYAVNNSEDVHTGVYKFDCTNPAQPVSWAFATGEVYLYNSVAVSGPDVFVATSAGIFGLLVFDMSDASNIIEKAAYRTDYSGYVRVGLSGTTVYLLSTNGYIDALDVTNPAAPRKTGSVSTLAPLNRLRVFGNFLYTWVGTEYDTSSVTNDSLRIYQITR